MNNQSVKDFVRRHLKALLPTCTGGQQLMFKRMYSHENLELPISEVVDNMHDSKIEYALTQVERTVANNAKKAAKNDH